MLHFNFKLHPKKATLATTDKIMDPESFSGLQLLAFTSTPRQAHTQDISQPFVTTRRTAEPRALCWEQCQGVTEGRFSECPRSSRVTVSSLPCFKVVQMLFRGKSSGPGLEAES